MSEFNQKDYLVFNASVEDMIKYVERVSGTIHNPFPLRRHLFVAGSGYGKSMAAHRIANSLKLSYLNIHSDVHINDAVRQVEGKNLATSKRVLLNIQGIDMLTCVEQERIKHMIRSYPGVVIAEASSLAKVSPSLLKTFEGVYMFNIFELEDMELLITKFMKSSDFDINEALIKRFANYANAKTTRPEELANIAKNFIHKATKLKEAHKMSDDAFYALWVELF